MVATEHLAALTSAARTGRRETHSCRRRRAACQHRTRRHVRDVAPDARRGDLEGRAARQDRRAERPLSTRCTRASFAARWKLSTRRAASTGRKSKADALRDMAARYTADVAAAPDKRRFMFAFTNAEVATLNDSRPRLAQGARRPWRGSQLADRSRGAGLRDRRPDSIHRQRLRQEAKNAGLTNGRVGTITEIDTAGDRAARDRGARHGQGRRSRRSVSFIVGENGEAGEFNRFKHGYAGTIYRGQGRTLDSVLCLPFVAVAQFRRLCRFDAAPRGRADFRGARDRQRPRRHGAGPGSAGKQTCGDGLSGR